MTKDEELWACALYVLERYGNEVHAFITGRIEDLTGHGDAAGLKAWQLIACRVNQLIQDGKQVQ